MSVFPPAEGILQKRNIIIICEGEINEDPKNHIDHNNYHLSFLNSLYVRYHGKGFARR